MTDTKPKKLLPYEQSNLDSCLFVVAENGTIEKARALIEDGANVRAGDDHALRWAAFNGHTEMVQILLKAGANVHAQDDSALHSAAFDGHIEMVKILLANDANVHARDDNALPLAAQKGHTEIVRMLLAAGVNVHAQGDRALRWAAENGYMETVQVLVRHIFNPDDWRGKNRAEIEAEANTLHDKIKFEKSEHLHMAETILVDCALCCWEQIRPAPPKLQISPLPAQPRPL